MGEEKNTPTTIDSQSTDQSKTLLNVASLFLKERNYNEAIKTYNSLTDVNPEHIEAWYLKGNAFMETNDYAQAVVCFEKVLKSDYILDTYAWNSIGNAFFGVSDYHNAIECYDRSIKVDSNFSWAWRNKGLSLQAIRRHEEALKCFDMAIKLSPKYLTALNDKGNILFDLDKKREAIQCYDEAIKIDPDFTLSWQNKSFALNSIGLNDEAIKCYDEVIKREPANFEFWNIKGNMLYDNGRYTEAITCYNKVIELNPKTIFSRMNKALAMYRLEEIPAAKKLFKNNLDFFSEELKQEPGNINLWLKKALCHEFLDEFSAAEECYYEAEKIEPDNIDVLRGLGRIISDIKFDFYRGFTFASTILKHKDHDFFDEITYVASLLKINEYEKVITDSLTLLEKASTNYERCVLGYFILCSDVFKGNNEQIAKAVDQFFSYYKLAPAQFFVENKSVWNFGGLVKFFFESNLNIQSKFMLLTIIDLLNGKIKKGSLQFLTELSKNQTEKSDAEKTIPFGSLRRADPENKTSPSDRATITRNY